MITECVQNDLVGQDNNHPHHRQLLVAPETHLEAQAAYPQPPGPTQAYHLPPQRLRTRRLHRRPLPLPPNPHPKYAAKVAWRVRCREVATASKWS
ncbi:hypothetical protein ACFX2J_027871 [Malus domestica]